MTRNEFLERMAQFADKPIAYRFSPNQRWQYGLCAGRCEDFANGSFGYVLYCEVINAVHRLSAITTKTFEEWPETESREATPEEITGKSWALLSLQSSQSVSL